MEDRAPTETTPGTTRRFLYRDVIVINDSNDDRVLAENVTMVIDSSDNVYFGVFIKTLRSKNLIEANSSIFYFDVERSIFVHQGKDPLPQDVRVPLRKFSAVEEIKIKFRPAERRAPPQMMMASNINASTTNYNNNNSNNNNMMQHHQYYTSSSSSSAKSNSTINNSNATSSQSTGIFHRGGAGGCFADQRPAIGGVVFGNNILQSSLGDAFITTAQEPSAQQYWSDMPCNSVAQSEVFGDEGDFVEDDMFSNQFEFMSSGQTGNLNINGMAGAAAGSNSNNTAKPIPREKRVKERKIGYVHNRVQEWRNYYEQGVLNEHGRLQKVNLDVAAQLVGLSRKTLDDYYKYIRKAQDLHFDFKGRSEEKIGVLRNFVRDRQNRNHHSNNATNTNTTTTNTSNGGAKIEDPHSDAHSMLTTQSECNDNSSQESQQESNNNHYYSHSNLQQNNNHHVKIEDNTQSQNKLMNNKAAAVVLSLPPPYEHEIEWIKKNLPLKQLQELRKFQELKQTQMFNKRNSNSRAADASYIHHQDIASSSAMEIEGNMSAAPATEELQLPGLFKQSSIPFYVGGDNMHSHHQQQHHDHQVYQYDEFNYLNSDTDPHHNED